MFKNFKFFFLTTIMGCLGISNFATAQNAVPQQCKQLFSETEKLISEAEKQPGTHTQVRNIKNKLNQSKKQILEMELATQIKSCDQGLAKLNNLKNYTN